MNIDCGIKYCWVHEFSPLVSVVCCLGSGICNKLITCWEESYRHVRLLCHRLKKVIHNKESWKLQKNTCSRSLPKSTTKQHIKGITLKQKGVEIKHCEWAICCRCDQKEFQSLKHLLCIWFICPLIETTAQIKPWLYQSSISLWAGHELIHCYNYEGYTVRNMMGRWPWIVNIQGSGKRSSVACNLTDRK